MTEDKKPEIKIVVLGTKLSEIVAIGENMDIIEEDPSQCRCGKHINQTTKKFD